MFNELVAVVELTDNPNEEASWHAEVAAREAATRAGYADTDLTRSWADFRTLVVSASDGRRFSAIVKQRPGGTSFGVTRPPTDEELTQWSRARP